MSFPDWGRSYNALRVPLSSDWQCALVPARDVEEPTSWWSLSYDERQQKRKDMERQVEQDQRDFLRLFRVDLRKRDAQFSSDFPEYKAFIRNTLRASLWDTPVDGDGVVRVLGDAVRDGRLIPVINREWRGSRRVSRSYAPQSWPKRAPDPKPTVYGMLNGEYVPFGADGRLIDNSPYVSVKAKAAMATAASSAGSSGSGFDWLGAVETAAGAVLGDDDTEEDFSSDAGEDSTPLGDAQAFDYQPDMPDGDVDELAGMPFNGEPRTWISSMPGTMPQMRQYGPNGTPLTDFDFDAHHGNPNPHAHNWDGYNRDEGAPVSLLPW